MHCLLSQARNLDEKPMVERECERYCRMENNAQFIRTFGFSAWCDRSHEKYAMFLNRNTRCRFCEKVLQLQNFVRCCTVITSCPHSEIFCAGVIKILVETGAVLINSKCCSQASSPNKMRISHIFSSVIGQSTNIRNFQEVKSHTLGRVWGFLSGLQ